MKRISLLILLSYILFTYFCNCEKAKKFFRGKKHRVRSHVDLSTNKGKICIQMDQTLRARHKTCFLRPDTGPCRADIIQWYFDVKKRTCYRFFWGGCQGNGNRFETREKCEKYCYLDRSNIDNPIPHFCSLAYDYGNCFGHYNRWAWDKYSKACKPRIYSGCGGNQNNFETRQECIDTCVKAPNNSMHTYQHFTTCMPFDIQELQ